MQSYSKDTWIFVPLRVVPVLTWERNGYRCKMLRCKPIFFLTVSFTIYSVLLMATNLSGLFIVVMRKLKVKKLEVPFFQYLINGEVSFLFLERKTTR